MSWEVSFVERLARIGLEHVFNPYADRCDVHDLANAPAIRRGNLTATLAIRHAAGVEAIWVGRDLGHRGGRRTGLALTDEATLLGADAGVAGTRKATRGPALAERTAAVVWSVARRLPRAPLMWNAFPLHPHGPDDALSNRAHTARERRIAAWTIELLIERFSRPRLIAIGNDASSALDELGLAHDRVRHPSYGGQRAFVAGMEALHSIPSAAEHQVQARPPTQLSMRIGNGRACLAQPRPNALSPTGPGRPPTRRS